MKPLRRVRTEISTNTDKEGKCEGRHSRSSIADLAASLFFFFIPNPNLSLSLQFVRLR